MHMILFLDRLLDVVCTYYCVARVTCLVLYNCLSRDAMVSAAIVNLFFTRSYVTCQPHSGFKLVGGNGKRRDLKCLIFLNQAE